VAKPDVWDRSADTLLRAYVPRLLEDWLLDDPDRRHRALPGTLAFVDLSGFTALTERLARKGKEGAEEMSDALNALFGELMEVADRDGADLVKWGGDAILLLYRGDQHAARACRAAYDMRARLREVGVIHSEGATFRLRMSVGIHSDTFDFFLVGDPALHRELLVTGPAASEAARLEGLAVAGQIAISTATAAELDPRLIGAEIGPGALLVRARPTVTGLWRQRRSPETVDLRGVIPVAIREHLLAGAGIPEHRAVAVAFVQFAGTDAMLASQGPEATAAALDSVVRNVSHACHSHGVTFFESDINVDGGKIMLTAGAPRTGGHDADRLLRTARKIIDHEGELALRVGVNAGRVFSSDFGPAFRRTYSVKGDAVNTAARIMGKAQPGQVLATRAVYDAAETRFETTAVGPFQLKGKAEPLPALAIGRMALERVQTFDERPLVGRDKELAALLEAAEDARSGTGRVVELLGEPGIGKSRLVQELIHQAPDLAVAQVVCDEYQQATAYGVFRDLLQASFGINDRTPPDVAVSVVRRGVRDLAPDLEPWLPLIGSMLDLPMPETDATRDLDQQFRKQRLEAVLVDLVGRQLPGPSLFVVDDSQYLDSAACDLLNKLALSIGRRPWLLVVNRRDQPVGWVPDPELTTLALHLEPLEGDDAIALAAGAAGDRTLSRQLLESLTARAAGNPLFLQALAAQAVDGVEDLPTSIEDLVSAQIDQLTPAQRTVLRHAAVLGIQFARSELEELLVDQPVAADEAILGELGEFLVRGEAGGQIRFRHSLIRETAYSGLAYSSRRQLHRFVGEAMERAGRGDAEPELLSLHFLHAGSYDKAFRYARRGGETARAKYANVEAAELFGRAAEAGRRLGRGQVPTEDLGAVHEAVGDCWYLIGPSDPTAQAWARARAHYRDRPLDIARIVAKEARLDTRLRRFPRALQRLSRALGRLEGRVGPEVEVARAALETRYAMSRLSQGRFTEALDWGNRAVDSAARSGDSTSLARALGNLHTIHLTSGVPTERPLGEMTLELYIETGDLPGQAASTNNLAIDALDANRWPEAALQYGVAAEIYRRLGDTAGESMARGNLGELLVNQGRLGEARQCLSSALDAARAAEDVDLEAFVLMNLGRADVRTGDVAAGARLLDRARAMFVELGEVDELRRTDLARVEARLLADDPEEALRLADELMLGAELDAYHIRGDLYWLRGHALAGLRDLRQAEAEFRAGIESGLATGDLYPVAACRLGLARLGVPDADEQEADAARLLDELGVVGLPVGGLSREGRPAGR
jgi:class 3 adenylate cyclase/tetratricopeptide (TPR) repeat protein